MDGLLPQNAVEERKAQQRERVEYEIEAMRRMGAPRWAIAIRQEQLNAE